MCSFWYKFRYNPIHCRYLKKIWVIGILPRYELSFKYLNINISSSSSIWLILTNSLPSWHLIPNFQNSPNWVFNSVWLHWNPPSDLNVISYSDRSYICILQLYVFIYLQIQHKNETFLYKKICSLWINCRPYARILSGFE